jgi:hypothetical protein
MSTYSYQVLKKRTEERIEELKELIAKAPSDKYVLERNLNVNVSLLGHLQKTHEERGKYQPWQSKSVEI